MAVGKDPGDRGTLGTVDGQAPTIPRDRDVPERSEPLSSPTITPGPVAPGPTFLGPRIETDRTGVRALKRLGITDRDFLFPILFPQVTPSEEEDDTPRIPAIELI